MFLLFTSNATVKYQRDALTAVAVPLGSVLRMRYFEEHVSQSIRDLACNGDGNCHFNVTETTLCVQV